MALRLAVLTAMIATGCVVMTAATPKKKKAAAKKTAVARIPAIVYPAGGGYYEIPDLTLSVNSSNLPDFEKISKRRLLDAYGKPVTPWYSKYEGVSWDDREQSLVGFAGDYVYYLNPDLTVKKKVTSDTFYARFNKGRSPQTGKCAIVNDKGEVVGDYIYDLIGDFSEGYAAAVKGEKAGIVDMNGNVIVPFTYDYCDYWGDGDSDPLPMHVHHGLCAASRNDMWGVIDMKGNVVVPFEYEWIEVGSKGTVRACKNETNYYFDSMGQPIRSDKYIYAGDDPDAEIIPIYVTIDGNQKGGYMSHDGNILIQPQFDMVLLFNGPTALVKKNGAWHLIDRTGTIVKRNVAKWMIGELVG